MGLELFTPFANGFFGILHRFCTLRIIHDCAISLIIVGTNSYAIFKSFEGFLRLVAILKFSFRVFRFLLFFGFGFCRSRLAFFEI